MKKHESGIGMIIIMKKDTPKKNMDIIKKLYPYAEIKKEGEKEIKKDINK